MGRSLFVAGLQSAGVPGEPAATLARFERDVRTLRSTFDGLELVVAPELHLMALLPLLGESARPRAGAAVADEPVSMLDVSVRAGVLSLLDTLKRQGLAILMITHDLSTAARFADRIAVMYLGRIVEEGPAADVVRSPQHPYTRALLSVVPRRDPRERHTGQVLRGETPDAVRIPSGCRFHPRCPLAFDRCRSEEPPLAPTPAGHDAACLLI
jgi:oligopeptide/dipeptide ABC transporter ATP-binding protein